MLNYDYKASVIIPVYNCEKYLKRSLNSLINQTIGFNKIEIILINDGSIDDSGSICTEFSNKYPNIKYFSKQNEGLSKTRNLGLSKCSGKYIFFLDADDEFSKDTIKDVVDFFDLNYDYIDLVTFKIIQYLNYKPVLLHYRYQILRQSGIYNLKDFQNCHINQTNINICIKNNSKMILFDDSLNFKHEDLKFCCDVLKDKMKIGFCSTGKYIYHRDNASSIVNNEFVPEKIINASLNFYENLILNTNNSYDYFKAVVFNELRWQLKEKKLLPDSRNVDISSIQKRINCLLSIIDTRIFISHPSATDMQIAYWLLRKPNLTKSFFICDGTYYVCINGTSYFSGNSFKYQIVNKSIIIKSVSFLFIEKSRISILYNNYGHDFILNNSIYADGFDLEKVALIVDNIDSVSKLKLIVDGNVFPLIKI